MFSFLFHSIFVGRSECDKHNVRCSKIVTNFSNSSCSHRLRETTGHEDKMGQAINHSLNTLFLSLVTHQTCFLLFLYTKGVTSWPWIEVRDEEE